MKWLAANKWWIASAIVIVSVGWISYANALDIGFWTDDYDFLEAAGRLDWLAYLQTYFDPRLQWHWYRPMQGLAWGLGYAWFGLDPRGHHAAQVSLHIANTLLLFALVARITQRWRSAFLGTLLYETLPVYGLAVWWPGVADPLVAVFFLSTLWLWLNYLERGGGRRFAVAYLFFVATLFSKEVGVVLPGVLFLADRWIIRQTLSLRSLFQRYILFLLTLCVYGLLELRVLTYGVFTQQLGYGVGGHIFFSLLHHLTTLAFPWSAPSPLNYLWLLILLACFAYVAYRRGWHILFLGATMILTMLPILPFHPNIASAARYLYLPLMGSMVGAGFLLNGVANRVRPQMGRVAILGSALGISVLVGWQSSVLIEGAENFAATVRAERLQFRPIFQRYSSFAPGTLLYFILPTYPNLSGLMFTRYGAEVITRTTDAGQPVILRDYPAAVLFYRDEENNWRAQKAEQTPLSTQIVPALPVRFAQPIVLEHIELASQRIKRGESIIVLFFWRLTDRIDKNYTLFFHLLDAHGQRVDGVDRLLRDGEPLLSNWRVGEMMADGIALPIDDDLSPGEYTIEIGLYDADTMQRLAIIDATGQTITTQISIGPIWIVE